MLGLFRLGVPDRDTGDFDWSDRVDERFVEVRRSAGSIAAASGCAAGRPFASAGACCSQSRVLRKEYTVPESHLLPRALASCLDAISTLDHIGLQADRTRPSVQLEKQAAGVAEHRALLIASPERCSACRAVLAYGL